VLVLVSQGGGDQLESFAGLSQRSPFLAFAMLVAMASLAGVPFTAGFLGKFLSSTPPFLLTISDSLSSPSSPVGAGFYYYFKVVRAIYWDAPPSSAGKIVVSPLTRFSIIVMIAGTFLLGVYPQPIFDALR
jgi:NADH-quinone oxidoreductase subunit N